MPFLHHWVSVRLKRMPKRRWDGNATPPKKLRNNPNTISFVSCVKRIQFTPSSTTTPPDWYDDPSDSSNTLKRFPPSTVNQADFSKKTSLTHPWMHYKKLHQQHSDPSSTSRRSGRNWTRTNGSDFGMKFSWFENPFQSSCSSSSSLDVSFAH